MVSASDVHPAARARLRVVEDPAVVLTLDHRIITTNAAYRARYGRLPKGENLCFRVSHGYERPCHLEGETCPVRAALATGRPSRVTHHHRHANGTEERCDIELLPIADEAGRIVQLIEIMRPVGRAPSHGGMIGDSPVMREVFNLISAAGPTEIPVLLTGETGTGKELAAQALHEASARRTGPLVAVECPGVAEGLFESELFGHEKGAFTGAERQHEGLVEAARGGTLFLDEVGDLSPNTQVKLLRLLEAGTYRRVGSTEPRRVDFRVIAATHRDLPAMVAAGQMRRDLYYRLAAFPVELPPLRERTADLPVLVQAFLPERSISDAAMNALSRWSWPGNVRELRNVLGRAAILSAGGSVELEHLPTALRERRDRADSSVTWPWGDEILALDEIELRYLAWAVERPGLSRKAVAKALGLSERQLYRRLRELEKKPSRA